MRKPNQNTTRARIVIAGAGVVIAGSRMIITGVRIIIAGTPYVFCGENHKNRFLLTLTLVFSGYHHQSHGHDPYHQNRQHHHGAGGFEANPYMMQQNKFGSMASYPPVGGRSAHEN
ncbi:hypothetical protein DY000_02008329 [Brassica cretica]|uniref:Uncharacterized protein n=1 Tax=Brassica cretica TaxID=69181 RepID=A0ABQ7CA59_BRACR|nr:hypothetical protein DY000_02008329 [Brassica cretica]